MSGQRDGYRRLALWHRRHIQGNNPTGGNISITTGAGDVIRSGGTGINAKVIATSAGLKHDHHHDAEGTINSGYNFFQGGGTPSGISAG